MSLKPCIACGDEHDNIDMFQVWPPESSPPPWDEKAESHVNYVATKFEPWLEETSDIIIHLCPACWKRVLEPS